SFTDLPADVLALVADALALVRLGRAHLANLRGDLADLLLRDPLDDDLGWHRHLERNALRGLDHDRVRVADIEPEVRALHRGTVADALQLEPLLETLRDALDHVRDQRPRQAVQRAIVAALGRTRHREDTVGLLDLHARGHVLGQLAERAVDHHAPRR